MAYKKPRRFVYWIAEHRNDNQCYSLIGRTKKEVVDQLQNRNLDPTDFDAIKKVMVEYDDLFDLFDWVTSEGGGRACGIPFTKD